MKKYHVVYRITNLINQMYYIGIHSTNPLKSASELYNNKYTHDKGRKYIEFIWPYAGYKHNIGLEKIKWQDELVISENNN